MAILTKYGHGRKSSGNGLAKTLKNLKTSPAAVVAVVTLGSGGILFGVFWVVATLWSWHSNALPSNLPEKPDFEAISKMPEEKRKKVLEYYGRTSTQRRRDDSRDRSSSNQLSEAEAKQRAEEWRKRREEMEKLSEEDRHVMRAAAMEVHQAEMNKQMKEFFALTPEEQTKKLDERIDRMVEMQKEREKRMAERKAQEATNANAQGGSNSGREGGGRPARSSDPDKRTEHFRNRLDESTPEERAMRTAYFMALQKRAKERGVTMSMGGRGGR
ncbi:MAG: hypothetical protein JXR97_05550 [Planctomycetes bacterium]|nr:hypothetical protein [Planctomycetota bacterium]